MRLRAAVAAAAIIVLGAPPAAAHNLGTAEPTNYRTRITGVTGGVEGVDMTVVEAGGRLELANRTDTDVIVLGYQQEPYLRVGPDGVFENVRSPAVYLNRERVPTDDPPATADPEAEPVWQKVDSGTTVRWHDHRVHYMGNRPPPAVRRNPDERHVILEAWEVPLRHDEDEIVYTGDLTWVPGPSRLPRLALSVLAGAALIGLGLRRWRGTPERAWRYLLAGLLVALTALDMFRLGGLASDAGVSFFSAAGDNVLGIMTWVVALTAAVALVARGMLAAAPIVAAAGVLFMVGSAVDLDILNRSQLPGTTPDWLARLAVTAGFGLGLGIAGTATARILRPAGLWPAPRPDGGR